MTELPHETAYAQLGDVADFYAGSSLPEGEDWAGQQGGYLLARVSDMNLAGNEQELLATQRWSAKPGQASATCPGGAVILPKRGGAIATNKKRVVKRPTVLDPNLMAVRPRYGLIDVNYLYQWFLSFDLEQVVSGSSVPQLNKKDLIPLVLPLPSLGEQERIAAALDQVDALRAKRREAIALLDDLAQSLFAQDFCTDHLGYGGWPAGNFGDYVDEFSYGTSQKSTNEGLVVLRIPNVVNGVLDLENLKTVSLSEAEARRLRLDEGDLLFVRSNGNPNYVGRCAVFQGDHFAARFEQRHVVFASYLIRARLPKSVLRPEFVHAYMCSDAGRAALRKLCKTSAGQYNLNIKGLSSVRLPIPPIELQERFVAKMAALKERRQQHVAHLAALDELFTSLQQRAFNGTLWQDQAA